MVTFSLKTNNIFLDVSYKRTKWNLKETFSDWHIKLINDNLDKLCRYAWKNRAVYDVGII